MENKKIIKNLQNKTTNTPNKIMAYQNKIKNSQDKIKNPEKKIKNDLDTELFEKEQILNKLSGKKWKTKDKINNKIKEKDQSLVDTVEKIEDEIEKIVVGQKDVVRKIILVILCDGHVLVEGVPGIAKTLILRTIAKIMGCDMKRVQFTVDLLPTDITGITSYTPKKGFEFIKGPVFTNFLLADEINRSPAKTQSALLEAMQEKTVSVGGKTYSLPPPFFVMATENPIETSGVYTLPEAQIDRFLFKILIDYPGIDDEKKILIKNITIRNFEDYKLKKILSPEKIIELQKKVKEVYTSSQIKDYIVNIVNETRSDKFEYAKYISYGASPRASIALYIASKAEALLNGRNYVIPLDVRTVAYPVMRHRILLNYEAEAEKINTDEIITFILDKMRVI